MIVKLSLQSLVSQFSCGVAIVPKPNVARWLSARMPDSQSREPQFESNLVLFKTGAFLFFP